MAVVMKYEDERVNPETGQPEIYEWSAIFSDEDAAIAQAGQDIAEGRNPVVINDWVPEGNTLRAVMKTKPGKTLVDKDALHKRAKEHGPTIT